MSGLGKCDQKLDERGREEGSKAKGQAFALLGLRVTTRIISGTDKYLYWSP